MANVPRLSKILRGKDTKPQTELESAIKYAIDNAGGGGSSLPEPGTSGNVLTSTGTGWESAEPQGGNNDYYVDFIYGSPTTTETTCADVLAALADGKNVIGKIDLGTQKLDFTLCSARADKCIFVGAVSEHDIKVIALTDQYGAPLCEVYDREFVPKGSNDGDILVWDDDHGKWVSAADALPSIPANSNGKVLGVDDGAYALIDSKAPLIVHGTADPLSAHTADITDDISLADIYTAAQGGRYVAFECPLDTGNVTRIPLAGYTKNGDNYEIAFSVASNTTGNPATIGVVFETGQAGTANIYLPQ